MRGAFIVQLGRETNGPEGRFEGWVQEVDTCIERRFHTSEELLRFIGQRFEVATDPARKVQAGCSEAVPLPKKTVRKQKRGDR